MRKVAVRLPRQLQQALQKVQSQEVSCWLLSDAQTRTKG
jgi:antitoxin component of MazEF toxin-antitoxin module